MYQHSFTNSCSFPPKAGLDHAGGNALTDPTATLLATFKKAEGEYININESKIRAEFAEREDD